MPYVTPPTILNFGWLAATVSIHKRLWANDDTLTLEIEGYGVVVEVERTHTGAIRVRVVNGAPKYEGLILSETVLQQEAWMKVQREAYRAEQEGKTDATT